MSPQQPDPAPATTPANGSAAAPAAEPRRRRGIGWFLIVLFSFGLFGMPFIIAAVMLLRP